MIWSGIVELVQAAILTLAQLCNGSIGSAVMLATVIVRMAMLPLGVFLARRQRQQQAILASLEPAIARLKARHADDQLLLAEKTLELQRRAGYRVLDPLSLLGATLQLPPFLALYSAVRRGLGAGARFLWITDLARPNLLLSLVVSGLSGASAFALQPSAQKSAAPMLALIATGATLAFLLATSSTLALSYGAGSLVSLLQSWLIRRDERALAR